jgi:hypothetical protein
MWQKRMLSFITPRVRLNLLGGREPLRFSVAWLCCATFLFWEDNAMPDYEKLYHLMVNAAEDALTALEDANIWDAKRILIDAEQRAEENYVTSMD